MAREKPIIGASVLVQRKEGHVLLVERLNDPGKRKWAFPGGKVEYGETVEESAVREVKEETNIDVKLKELLGPYNIISDEYHYVTICFTGFPKNTKVVSGSDVGGSRWVLPENLDGVELTSTTAIALSDVGIL